MIFLNNREIATGIWLFIIFIYSISGKKTRNSLLSVFKKSLVPKIFIPTLLYIIYITGIIYLLFLFGLWELSFITQSIIWLCFNGVVMTFGFVMHFRERKFKNIIIENIRIILIVEFISNAYTFSLGWELILIPFFTILIVLIEFGKNDQSNNSAVALLNWVMGISGLIMISFFIIKLISDINNIFNLSTLMGFLLPIVLAISSIPFIYFLIIYSLYEQIFLRLDIFKKKNKDVIRYAKKEIAKYCLINIRKLKNITNPQIYNIMLITTFEEVDKLITTQNKFKNI